MYMLTVALAGQYFTQTGFDVSNHAITWVQALGGGIILEMQPCSSSHLLRNAANWPDAC